MSYLFNIFDYDKREVKHKSHKVEKNKYKMANMSNNIIKPIKLDGNEKALNSSYKKEVDIIKNY